MHSNPTRSAKTAPPIQGCRGGAKQIAPETPKIAPGDVKIRSMTNNQEHESTTAQVQILRSSDLPKKPGTLIGVTGFGCHDAVAPMPAYLHGGDWFRLDGEPWPGNDGYLEGPAHDINGWIPLPVQKLVEEAGR